MEDIDFIKWWGAVVATIALSWNFFNFFLSNARMKVKLKPNTCYPDSRVISKEVSEHGTSSTLASYCHKEIVNVGRVAGTITKIEASHTSKNGSTLTKTDQRFQSHTHQNFPILLAPGEIWSGRIEMEDLIDLSKYGKLIFSVEFGYRDRPVKVHARIG
ncbi:hypothetical protein [Microbulbifer sp. TRSA005]|uniref:hypothetical protein n=1 Tax=unclassified Microbulbifer TaxID=2619833 RepID=UPI00403A4BB2